MRCSARRVYGTLAIATAGLVPVSVVTGLVDSVRFGALLTQAGIVTGLCALWNASRAGEDVVEAMVEDPRVPTEGST